jgi:hypothetical protein
VLALAIVGCEKTNDVPRMQDEAQAVAKTYQDQVDDLARRIQAIGPRVTALAGDALNTASAQRAYQEATTLLTRARNDLRQLPAHARESTSADDLQKLIANLHEKIGDSVLEATSDVEAVESWVATAEQQRRAGASPAQPATAATSPTSEDPAAASAPSR